MGYSRNSGTASDGLPILKRAGKTASLEKTRNFSRRKYTVCERTIHEVSDTHALTHANKQISHSRAR